MSDGRNDRARDRETIRAEVAAITARGTYAEAAEGHVAVCVVAQLEELTRAVCNLAETLDAVSPTRRGL